MRGTRRLPIMTDIRSLAIHRPPEANVISTESLDKSTIAELSSATIERMTRDELLRVIRASCLPARHFTPESAKHWELLDEPALKRLAYLARRCCQNQGY